MSGRYEVLLRRANGINKTVIIDDCMSESEARETAEAMYGMEALRALWKGNSSSYTSGSTSSSGSNWSTSTDGDSSGASIIGLLGLALVGGLVMLVVQFWWIFLIVGVVLGGLIALGWNDNE
jgi:MYXO-CTERM domain-containing protein